VDTNTLLLLVVLIFAVVVIASFFVFRQRGKAEIHGPLGTSLKLDASNEKQAPPPAVNVQDARSSEGGLLAEDRTGRGVNVARVEVKTDILASSESPTEKTDPKA